MLTDEDIELKAADYEMIRKVLSDNSITMASVERGDFGETIRKAAEEFPFEGDAESDYASVN